MRLWPLPFITRKETHPLFEQNRRFFARVDQSCPVGAYDFVVFDTELTGLHRHRDEVVAIGAVRIRNLQILAGEIFHSYVRPTIALPKDSTLIHGITPQQLENAPHLREVLPAFVEFCGPSLLVGQYVSLDVGFVNRAARKLFGATIRNPCLDTLRLAQIYTETCWEHYHDQFNLQISYNLGDLVRQYGLPAFDKHDALQDAMQTAYLFLYLIKKLKVQGYETLKDIFQAGESWRRIF
jgi:DNA polymerase III subunit epsilon